MSEPTVTAPPQLVGTHRFWVHLTPSAERMSTRRPPPKLDLPASPRQPPAAAAGGRPRTAPQSTASTGARRNGTGTPLDRAGIGGFQECSGLELEAEPKDYVEGARNDGVVRRVGRVKLVPIVLKRGMLVATRGGFADTSLWDWLQGMVSGEGPPQRYDGRVEVRDPTGVRVVASWSFDRALPLKVSGPSLNGKTGEIAIEELHLGHEGLRLAKP